MEISITTPGRHVASRESNLMRALRQAMETDLNALYHKMQPAIMPPKDMAERTDEKKHEPITTISEEINAAIDPKNGDAWRDQCSQPRGQPSDAKNTSLSTRHVHQRSLEGGLPEVKTSRDIKHEKRHGLAKDKRSSSKSVPVIGEDDKSTDVRLVPGQIGEGMRAKPFPTSPVDTPCDATAVSSSRIKQQKDGRVPPPVTHADLYTRMDDLEDINKSASNRVSVPELHEEDAKPTRTRRTANTSHDGTHTRQNKQTKRTKNSKATPDHMSHGDAHKRTRAKRAPSTETDHQDLRVSPTLKEGEYPESQKTERHLGSGEQTCREKMSEYESPLPPYSYPLRPNDRPRHGHFDHDQDNKSDHAGDDEDEEERGLVGQARALDVSEVYIDPLVQMELRTHRIQAMCDTCQESMKNKLAPPNHQCKRDRLALTPRKPVSFIRIPRGNVQGYELCEAGEACDGKCGYPHTVKERDIWLVCRYKPHIMDVWEALADRFPPESSMKKTPEGEVPTTSKRVRQTMPTTPPELYESYIDPGASSVSSDGAEGQPARGREEARRAVQDITIVGTPSTTEHVATDIFGEEEPALFPAQPLWEPTVTPTPTSRRRAQVADENLGVASEGALQRWQREHWYCEQCKMNHNYQQSCGNTWVCPGCNTLCETHQYCRQRCGFWACNHVIKLGRHKEPVFCDKVNPGTDIECTRCHTPRDAPGPSPRSTDSNTGLSEGSISLPGYGVIPRAWDSSKLVVKIAEQYHWNMRVTKRTYYDVIIEQYHFHYGRILSVKELREGLFKFLQARENTKVPGLNKTYRAMIESDSKPKMVWPEYLRHVTRGGDLDSPGIMAVAVYLDVPIYVYHVTHRRTLRYDPGRPKNPEQQKIPLIIVVTEYHYFGMRPNPDVDYSHWQCPCHVVHDTADRRECRRCGEYFCHMCNSINPKGGKCGYCNQTEVRRLCGHVLFTELGLKKFKTIASCEMCQKQKQARKMAREAERTGDPELTASTVSGITSDTFDDNNDNSNEISLLKSRVGHNSCNPFPAESPSSESLGSADDMHYAREEASLSSPGVTDEVSVSPPGVARQESQDMLDCILQWETYNYTHNNCHDARTDVTYFTSPGSATRDSYLKVPAYSGQFIPHRPLDTQAPPSHGTTRNHQRDARRDHSLGRPAAMTSATFPQARASQDVKSRGSITCRTAATEHQKAATIKKRLYDGIDVDKVAPLPEPSGAKRVESDPDVVLLEAHAAASKKWPVGSRHYVKYVQDELSDSDIGPLDEESMKELISIHYEAKRASLEDPSQYTTLLSTLLEEMADINGRSFIMECATRKERTRFLTTHNGMGRTLYVEVTNWDTAAASLDCDQRTPDKKELPSSGGDGALSGQRSAATGKSPHNPMYQRLVRCG